jgi:hypothetical protein
MQTVYIGIDDTDVLGGPGTGRVAREMGAHLASLGLGHFVGVVRHQLLVDPRIPYTSHNSSKCVLFEADVSPVELAPGCAEYIAAHFQDGSDPGLCIALEGQSSAELLAFGRRAQREYLTKQAALDLAARSGIMLKELGGTGGGVIGALAAVALSIGGSDGRYVQLRGIKEIQGLVTAAEVKKRTDTTSVVDENGQAVPDAAIIDSLGWLRPSRLGGQPVLRVRLEKVDGGPSVWRPVERKLRTHAKG